MGALAVCYETHDPKKEITGDAPLDVTDARRAWDDFTAGFSPKEFAKLLAYDGPVENGTVYPLPRKRPRLTAGRLG